jgi:hypothetical protein
MAGYRIDRGQDGRRQKNLHLGFAVKALICLTHVKRETKEPETTQNYRFVNPEFARIVGMHAMREFSNL